MAINMSPERPSKRVKVESPSPPKHRPSPFDRRRVPVHSTGLSTHTTHPSSRISSRSPGPSTCTPVPSPSSSSYAHDRSTTTTLLTTDVANECKRNTSHLTPQAPSANPFHSSLPKVPSFTGASNDSTSTPNITSPAPTRPVPQAQTSSDANSSTVTLNHVTPSSKPLFPRKHRGTRDVDGPPAPPPINPNTLFAPVTSVNELLITSVRIWGDSLAWCYDREFFYTKDTMVSAKLCDSCFHKLELETHDQDSNFTPLPTSESVFDPEYVLRKSALMVRRFGTLDQMLTPTCNYDDEELDFGSPHLLGSNRRDEGNESQGDNDFPRSPDIDDSDVL